MRSKLFSAFTFFALTVSVSVVAVPTWASNLLPQDADAERLARSVQSIFKANCFYCHGEPGKKVRGGFDSVLDFEKLRSNPDFINLSDPAQSSLYQRIESDEMPKVRQLSKDELAATGIRKLTQKEKDTVLAWIKAGAPSTAGEEKGRVLQDAGTASYSYLFGAIARDLERLPERKRRDIRYLSLAHLPAAGDSADDLDIFRDALTKLVNSLSSQESLFPLQAIDANRLVYRVDIGALGWSAQVWDRVAGSSPYLSYGYAFDSAVSFIQIQTGTGLFYTRGDWFAFAAARPPLYYQFLNIPDTDTALERDLVGIDVDRDIKSRRVLRAAFTDSGVSQNNRMIERHKIRDGAYWKSYDFKESTGASDLFSRPLGPGDGAGQFKHAGGEIIWNLPNGLQAYMLVTSDHQRIDEAPTPIVQDASRRNAVIVNGISCISCHNQGIQRRSDQVRAYVDKNTSLFRQEDLDEIFSTYRGNDALQAAFTEDSRRFIEAMKNAGVKRTGSGDPEPIRYLTDRFENDVDLKRAAAEFGISLPDLIQIASIYPELQAFVSRVNAHAVPRAFFSDVYRKIVDMIQREMPSDLDLEFVPIPGGTFQMGSPDSEPGRYRNEKRHWVRVDGFEMGVTPVTQRQWYSVMRGTGLLETVRAIHDGEAFCPDTFDPVLKICPNNPVDSVSWDGAQAFIRNLNKKSNDGFTYRLPTEAEWEWAARGGNPGSFFFGEDDDAYTKLKEVAWFSENSGRITHEVELHRGKRNGFGLIDMHGNVHQWVQDFYDVNYGLSDTQLAGTTHNPLGPSSGKERVYRGGSWLSVARDLRSASRGALVPECHQGGIQGLRLVRTR
ncbi:MAG: SUMF1/EgtB/PvdO family nonheme iron enzyme [Bacteriovoracia bacterium]